MGMDAPFVIYAAMRQSGRIEKWKEENQIGEQEEEEEATLAREAQSHSHMRSRRSLYYKMISEDRMHSSPKGLAVGVNSQPPITPLVEGTAHGARADGQLSTLSFWRRRWWFQEWLRVEFQKKPYVFFSGSECLGLQSLDFDKCHPFW